MEAGEEVEVLGTVEAGEVEEEVLCSVEAGEVEEEEVPTIPTFVPRQPWVISMVSATVT